MSENYDVQFRHLAVETDAGVIEGIGLWYPKKPEAITSFSYFQKYITTSGRTNKSLEMAFLSEPPGHILFSFLIEINIADETYKTIINGVEAKYVESIRSYLAKFPYFFMAAGYVDSDGQPQLLPLKQFHFFRNRIEIDGELIEGVPNPKWPLNPFENIPE